MFWTLINHVSHDVFEYIEDCASFDMAIDALIRLYVKTLNEIFARHLIATRRQHSDETLSKFLQELRKLSKDCNIKPVNAKQYFD